MTVAPLAAKVFAATLAKGQAFGVFTGAELTGERAQVWTDSAPGDYPYIASPVAVCATSPVCLPTEGFFARVM